MFVGQAPGSDEDVEGKCFIGSAGQFLEDVIRGESLSRHSIYLTNLAKCYPPNDRKPKKKESEACYERFLSKEIEQLKPEVIVPLGGACLKFFTGKEKIESFGGMVNDSIRDIGDAVLFPCVHPAAPLHSGSKLAIFTAQIQALRDYLNDGERDWSHLDYRLINSEADWTKLYKMLLAYDGPISFDYETNDTVDPMQKGAAIRAVGFCVRPGKACCVELAEPAEQYEISKTPKGKPVYGTRLRPTLIKRIKPNLQRLFREKTFVAHNAKFEIKWTSHFFGIEPNVAYDTMIMHYLLDENSGHRLTGLQGMEPEVAGYDSWMRRYLGDGGSYAKAPIDQLCFYNCGDVDLGLRLYRTFRKEIIKDDGLAYNWSKVGLPVVRTLARLELRGMYIDRDAMAVAYDECMSVLEECEVEFWSHPEAEKLDAERKADGKKDPVNFNSDSQMARYLQLMGISTGKKTKGGKISYSKKYVEPLVEEYPILGTKLRYGSHCSFRDNFLEKIDQVTVGDYLRCDWKQDLVVTGRLSSSPNQQNWPKTGPVKSMFASRWGKTGSMIQIDFSNLEVRLAANESGDRKLWEMLDNGMDHHSYSSSLMFDVEYDRLHTAYKNEEDWAKKMRDKGKRCNFGIIYGITEYGLAEQLGISQAAALEFIELYKKAYPELYDWFMDQHDHVRRYGMLRSRMGMIRRFPEIMGGQADKWAIDRILRQAGNFPIQNKGAQICLWSMATVDQGLLDAGAKSIVVGSVHDSLYIDAAEDEVQDVIELCKTTMTDRSFDEFRWLKKPLPVDVSVGPSLRELKGHED